MLLIIFAFCCFIAQNIRWAFSYRPQLQQDLGAALLALVPVQRLVGKVSTPFSPGSPPMRGD
ncbi:hypothetical protein EON65_51110 [archaeon]|nr:MAG: hypothetical protein EON65_51110 [archaeon]